MARTKNWSVTSFGAVDEWRRSEALTVRGACRRLGVTTSTWGNWKNGTCVPPAHTQRRLLAVMHPQAPEEVGSAASATGAIVAAYLKENRVSARELPALVQSVRRALGGAR